MWGRTNETDGACPVWMEEMLGGYLKRPDGIIREGASVWQRYDDMQVWCARCAPMCVGEEKCGVLIT